MDKQELSCKVTLWVGRFVAALLVALMFLLPWILEWYDRVWSIPRLGKWVIAIAYYLCQPLILPALWNIDRLLLSILHQEVFTKENVDRIRRVRWYCAGVGAICLPAGPFFTPLYFLAVMMFFLAFIVSVIKNVMAAAVELREENDLTV